MVRTDRTDLFLYIAVAAVFAAAVAAIVAGFRLHVFTA